MTAIMSLRSGWRTGHMLSRIEAIRPQLNLLPRVGGRRRASVARVSYLPRDKQRE